MFAGARYPVQALHAIDHDSNFELQLQQAWPWQAPRLFSQQAVYV
jgi:hypothetical protein